MTQQDTVHERPVSRWVHPNWQGYRVASWVGQAVLAFALLTVLMRGNLQGALTISGFLLAAFIFVTRDEWLPRLFDLLFVLAALINAGGWVWDLYNAPGPYDEIAHGFTIFAITLALGFLTYRTLLAGFVDHPLLLVLTIASFGIAIGALWEVAEWTADFFVAKQIVSGLDDTISDLIMDSIGAVLAGWATMIVLPRKG